MFMIVWASNVVVSCLFFGLLVFFCPLATLWLIGRWSHIFGCDACKVNPLHPIVVEICEVTKINLPFHYWWFFSFLLAGQPIEVCISKHTKHEWKWMFNVLGVLFCISWELFAMYLQSLSLIHKKQAWPCNVLQTWQHHAWWCPILFPNSIQILEHN